MYLSRIAIDVKKHESMKALYNLEILHGMIERSFNGERKRRLWRVDQIMGESYLLLLSDTPPHNNDLPNQIGYKNCVWETKSYDALLERVNEGSTWHFRLTVNPTVSVFTDDKKRGKVKAITVAQKQREWLKRQSIVKGFVLQDSQYDVIQSDWKTIKKDGREIQILAVTFEGALRITDSEIFRQTLVSGIGREKAYGMGLLTVVPYE